MDKLVKMNQTSVGKYRKQWHTRDEEDEEMKIKVSKNLKERKKRSVFCFRTTGPGVDCNMSGWAVAQQVGSSVTLIPKLQCCNVQYLNPSYLKAQLNLRSKHFQEPASQRNDKKTQKHNVTKKQKRK